MLNRRGFFVYSDLFKVIPESIEAVLLLSKLISFGQVWSAGFGELMKELGLTRKRFDKARRVLKERGFISEFRLGFPAKGYIKVNWDKLENLQIFADCPVGTNSVKITEFAPVEIGGNGQNFAKFMFFAKFNGNGDLQNLQNFADCPAGANCGDNSSYNNISFLFLFKRNGNKKNNNNNIYDDSLHFRDKLENFENFAGFSAPQSPQNLENLQDFADCPAGDKLENLQNFAVCPTKSEVVVMDMKYLELLKEFYETRKLPNAINYSTLVQTEEKPKIKILPHPTRPGVFTSVEGIVLDVLSKSKRFWRLNFEEKYVCHLINSALANGELSIEEFNQAITSFDISNANNIMYLVKTILNIKNIQTKSRIDTEIEKLEKEMNEYKELASKALERKNEREFRHYFKLFKLKAEEIQKLKNKK